MTTKNLEPVDFMMMDVHRPLTDEEIKTINPQAVVDKSLRLVSNDDGEAEGVGAPHEEKPSQRCTFCFGPMPCEKHANVEHLDILTASDITVTNTLAIANNAQLMSVVVVGLHEDGTEFIASSAGPVPEVMYLLQRGIHKCNKAVDTAEDIIGGPNGPKERA